MGFPPVAQESAQDIVCLSRVPWDGLYQRPQRLAVGLARDYRVLYVDTPRSTIFRRVVRPLLARKPVRPFLWQPAPGLTVLSPAFVPFLPGWWPPPGQYALSLLCLRWAMRHMGMASPIVWAEDPRDLYFLDALAPRLVCYDCMDDYALIAPADQARSVLWAQERAILTRSNLVFASSRALARRCAQTNPNVTLVPNGVDMERFGRAAAAPVPPDLAGIPGPRLGYIGSLAAWVDFDLLEAVARARPQWSLVLIGPILNGADAQVAALRRRRNVHILGEKLHTAIPAYLHGFDVCLIPFRLNGLTHAVNPVKFYEYMAAARPVVATPLSELTPHAGVCTLAGDAQGFIAGIEAALREGDSPTLAAQRLAIARANSWDQRVQTIVAALEGALHTKRP